MLAYRLGLGHCEKGAAMAMVAERENDAPDQWRAADPELAEVIGVMAEAAAGHVHQMLAWDDQNTVDSPRLLGCEVYSALQTDEHTDDGYPRWTVLLVLRTNGHTVTVNDGAEVMTPAVGDLLLFNLHQTHVLDLPEAAFPPNEDGYWTEEHIAACCRDYPFVCAHIDLEIRPTRKQAEALLLEQLRPTLSHGTGMRGPGPGGP